jgi:hypothetical protein
MWDDPIVNEVRKTREALAERFDFDVTAIFEDLRGQQANLGKKLVRRNRVLPQGREAGVRFASLRDC